MTHPYSSAEYVNALAANRDTVELPECRTVAILDVIPGSSRVDATGPYPFTSLRQPQSFKKDVARLADRNVVSFTVVTDAIQEDTDWFSRTFDMARPFKTHYVVDHHTASVRLSKNHEYKVRRAKRFCEARVIALVDYLDEWCVLYNNLTMRHQLQGIHRFPRSYFEALANMPEFVAIGVFAVKRLVSCHIWLINGRYTYSHLGASNEEGYDLRAAYAGHAHALSVFRHCHIIDLGGTPDNGRAGLGLAQFKMGFANHTRTNWLCGAIVDRDYYDALCRNAGLDPQSPRYFPAYRAPTRQG